MSEILAPGPYTSTPRTRRGVQTPFTPSAPPLAGAVLLVTPWYGDGMGGVAVSTETLVGALKRAGVTVVVATMNGGDGRQSSRGRFGELVVPLCFYAREVARRGAKGTLGYYRRSLRSGLLVRQLVRRHGVRVAHLNFAMPEYAPLLSWLRGADVATVLTFRGSDVHQLPTGTRAAVELNAMVSVVDRVTAVSDGLLSCVLERVPAAHGKSSAVPNVAPLDVWDGVPTLPTERPRDIDLLFTGNLRPVKGPDFLLDAFRLIVDQRPSTSLSFVGSGEDEAQLAETVARLGLSAQVRFHGRAARADIPGFMRRARVLALPSRNEGMPLVAVEAQLYGTPVVGTAVGGIGEAVRHGETGFVVPFGDARGFADAALALLDDEVRWAAMSAAGRAWARAAFDPALAAARYVAIYQELLRGR